MSTKYWENTLDELLGDFKEYAEMTDEQKRSLALDFASAASMESEACGDLDIPNPLYAEIEKAEKKHKREVEELNFKNEALVKHIKSRWPKDSVHVTVDSQFGTVNIERAR